MGRFAVAVALVSFMAKPAAAGPKVRGSGKIGLGLGSGTLSNGLSLELPMGSTAIQVNLEPTATAGSATDSTNSGASP